MLKIDMMPQQNPEIWNTIRNISIDLWDPSRQVKGNVWATPQMLDSFGTFLSYTLYHLIGFLFVVIFPVGGVRRQALVGGMWPFHIVKIDPLPDPGLGFSAAAPRMQIYTFIYERAPQSFDENVVQ